jgi:hypothetical protein
VFDINDFISSLSGVQVNLILKRKAYLKNCCREQLTVRNMRSILAPVLLRLAGTRVVQESVESFCFTQHDTVLASGCDAEWNAETSAAAAAALMAGENLFDRILSILHALLSSTWASWLKQKPSKGSSRPPREVPPFDKETVHRMQASVQILHNAFVILRPLLL